MVSPRTDIIHHVTQSSPHLEPVEVAAADGAIKAINGGQVFITKGTAAALTLRAPQQNGVRLTVIATTAAAHTVTVTGGINGTGASGDVGTFGGAIGDGFEVVSYNGRWWLVAKTNVTFA